MAKLCKNHATGNAIVTMATLTSWQGCSEVCFLCEIAVTFEQHCLYENIVNFSHTSWIHFRFKNTPKNAIQTNGGRKTPKASPST